MHGGFFSGGGSGGGAAKLVNSDSHFRTVPAAAPQSFQTLVASQGLFYRLDTLVAARTVAKLFFRVSVSIGNYDMGLYSSDGTTLTRLGSMGSTVVLASGLVTATPAAAITQAAGVVHYVGFVCDNATASFLAHIAGVGDMYAVGREGGTLAASFPLPATVTLSALANASYTVALSGGPT